jgi:HAE1 family hydrophobic/amphiphilic exporter-1
VRLRPVLMTTGALICGLLPVALSAGSGSEFRAPMAMITVGGLLTSTLLTLVVVPVVYCLLDPLRVGSLARVGTAARDRLRGWSEILEIRLNLGRRS